MLKFKKIFIFSLLFLIIAWGAYLRFYKIGEQSYWIDEGYTLNAVVSILAKGYPILDSNQIYNAAYLNTYLISGAVSLGGFNPIAARSVAVVFGVGIIFLVYLIGRKFFNRWVGLGAAFLTAFSYWEIAWSRQARMYIQLQFFFLLSLYLFNSLLEKFSYKKLIWLILATAATILSHYFGYFLLGIYALNLIIRLTPEHYGKIKTFFRNKIRRLVVGAVIIIIALILIKLGFDLTGQISQRESFLGFSYQGFLWHYLPLIVITALAGMVIAVLKEKKSGSGLFLAGAYLIPYLIIIFSASVIHFRYLFFILPLLYIFSASLFGAIGEKLKKTNLIFPVLILALVLFSIIITPRSFSFLPRADYYLEPFTPQPDFKSAYEAIKVNGWDDNKTIISPFTQMDKVYLGRSDYWLAISLDGRKLDKSKLGEREYYNNAITIPDAEKLQNIIISKHGYIVVDDMALSVRLDKDIIDLIGQQKLIFSDQGNIGSRIWVFSF